jgi:hypothetical protein
MTTPDTTPATCPTCNSKLLAPAAVCPSCGADLAAASTAVVAPTAPAAPEAAEPKLIAATVAGAIAAIFFGVIWAGIATFTGYELGILAWAIGLGVGFAVSYFAKGRGMSLAVLACVLAVTGILAGKILTIYWAGPIMFAKEMEKNKETADQLIATVVLKDLKAEKTFSAEELALIDSEDQKIAPKDEALAEGIRAKIQERASGLSDPERLTLLKRAGSDIIGTLSIVSLLKEQFTMMDILWAALAIISAWRMCALKD